MIVYTSLPFIVLILCAVPISFIEAVGLLNQSKVRQSANPGGVPVQTRHASSTEEELEVRSIRAVRSRRKIWRAGSSTGCGIDIPKD